MFFRGDSGERNNIRSVHLPCDEGSLDWLEPSGALRLIFTNHKLHDKPSQFCFTIHSHNSDVIMTISHGLGSHTVTSSQRIPPHSPHEHFELCLDIIPLDIFLESLLYPTSEENFRSISFDYELATISQSATKDSPHYNGESSTLIKHTYIPDSSLD